MPYADVLENDVEHETVTRPDPRFTRKDRSALADAHPPHVEHEGRRERTLGFGACSIIGQLRGARCVGRSPTMPSNSSLEGCQVAKLGVGGPHVAVLAGSR